MNIVLEEKQGAQQSNSHYLVSFDFYFWGFVLILVEFGELILIPQNMSWYLDWCRLDRQDSHHRCLCCCCCGCCSCGSFCRRCRQRKVFLICPKFVSFPATSGCWTRRWTSRWSRCRRDNELFQLKTNYNELQTLSGIRRRFFIACNAFWQI